MAFRPWARAAVRFSRNLIVLRDWEYSRLLAKLNMPPWGLSTTRTGLRVDDLGITIPRADSSLLPHLHDALWLGRNLGMKFVDSSDGIVANTSELRFFVASGEEFYILREIFGDGVYGFTLPREEVVIWDIGMNVAFASLYFASQWNVRAVVGFEPFRPTFLAAQRNIALNPALAEKIDIRNFGIAGHAYATDVEFDPERRGGAAIHGISERLRKQIHVSGQPPRVEHIELLAADEVLLSIRSEYPDSSIVAKIDCEGCEYEIIRCLHEKGLLAELSVLMIEWHDRGPQELEAMLQKSGFVTYTPASSGEVGMVYAVAQNLPLAMQPPVRLSRTPLSSAAHA